MEEGLPVPLVHNMLEDDKGHFWMGGELGFARFDGKEFLLYDLKKMLSFGLITTTIQDKSGAIWFRFMNFGQRASRRSILGLNTPNNQQVNTNIDLPRRTRDTYNSPVFQLRTYQSLN